MNLITVPANSIQGCFPCIATVPWSTAFASLSERIRRRPTLPTKQIYHDSFGEQLTDLNNQMRWDLAGTARQEWNEKIYPRLHDIIRTKAEEIYEGENNADCLMIYRCYMLGRDKSYTHPTIVFFCTGKNAKQILERTIKVIYQDGEIRGSGFELRASLLADLEAKKNSMRRPVETPSWATGKSICRFELQCVRIYTSLDCSTSNSELRDVLRVWHGRCKKQILTSNRSYSFSH